MKSYKNSEPIPPIMVGSPPPLTMRVPFIDWDRPPYNRWAFQRVSEIIPTASIRRADVASQMPTANGDLNSFEFITFEGQRMSFAQMVDDTYTDAILVIKNGKVLHESYHNGMTEHTPHLLQSVSKSITATVAGTIIEEGLLNPAALVTDYLPELNDTAWKGASLQHVLDMTSGTIFDESDYANRESDVGKMDYCSGCKPAPEGVDVSNWPTCIWEQIISLKHANAEHGARFEYRSIEADVLAHAMERVTGKRLAQLISERLWQPIGCADDATITVDRLGYGLACGGISATLRDTTRFALALLNNGHFNSRQVVPQAWIQDIRHGKHGLYDELTAKQWPNGAYRNQFWVEDNALGRHYCFGVFGQMVIVAPDTGMVAVKFSTWPDAVDAKLSNLAVDALVEVDKSF